MAIVCGIIWSVIGNFVPFFYLNLLIAPGVGYAIGEVIGLSVNRKRGTGLAIVAGFAVVISYLVRIFLPLGFPLGIFNIVFDLVALGLGVWIAITRLR